MKEKLKKFVLKFFQGNHFILTLLKNVNCFIETIGFSVKVLFTRMDDKMVFFESFGGRKFTCSPKAVFEQMQKDERFDDYTFVWYFMDDAYYTYKHIADEYKNTIVIGRKERQHYLAKCRYIISNWNAPLFYYRRKGQEFVQFFHGKPLKRTGCDVLDVKGDITRGVKQIHREYRAYGRKYSLIFAPSKVAGDIFGTIWDIQDKSVIKLKGYPRNDSLFSYTEEDVIRLKNELGIPLDKKVILYAPTYRDNQYTDGKYSYKIEIDFDRFQKQLSDEYVFLLRVHYFVAKMTDVSKYKGFVYNVSDYPEINDLFKISDVLIADYSSLLFDYADVRKPMIFYMYDLEDYRDDIRGLYFDITKDLPGPIVKTQDELLEAVRKYPEEKDKYAEAYEAFIDKYSTYDNAHGAEECIDVIFFGKE